jgi:hypothetical protein
MRFDPAFRQQVSPDFHKNLETFEQLNGWFFEVTTRAVVWNPVEDLPAVFGNHLDLHYIAHGTKFMPLNRSLMAAVNNGDFLTYGLVG